MKHTLTLRTSLMIAPLARTPAGAAEQKAMPKQDVVEVNR